MNVQKSSIFEQLLDYEPLVNHINANFADQSKQIKTVEEFRNYFNYQISEHDKLLDKTRQELLLDNTVPPLVLLHKLKEICDSRRNSQKHPSLCQIYNKLKINSNNLASVLDNLEQVKVIPKNGLSNTDIERIFEIYENDIPSFKWLGILTSDFMVCNVQRYFQGQELEIDEDFIQAELERFQRSRNLKTINTKKGHPLTNIDAQQLKSLYDQGKTHIAMVLNTDWCVQGGSHWYALYINLQKKHILLFNSVGDQEYKKNIEPVKIFCKHLQQVMDELEYGGPTTLEFLEDDVQNIHNICGVYCILFVTCQLFGIPYQKVQELLKYERNRGERFVQLFKRALFG